jgi:hypothetical protein
MSGEVEKSAELGDRDLLWARSELDNRVPGLDIALFQDAEVEAGAMV